MEELGRIKDDAYVPSNSPDGRTGRGRSLHLVRTDVPQLIRF